MRRTAFPRLFPRARPPGSRRRANSLTGWRKQRLYYVAPRPEFLAVRCDRICHWVSEDLGSGIGPLRQAIERKRVPHPGQQDISGTTIARYLRCQVGGRRHGRFKIVRRAEDGEVASRRARPGRVIRVAEAVDAGAGQQDRSVLSGDATCWPVVPESPVWWKGRPRGW